MRRFKRFGIIPSRANRCCAWKNSLAVSAPSEIANTYTGTTAYQPWLPKIPTGDLQQFNARHPISSMAGQLGSFMALDALSSGGATAAAGNLGARLLNLAKEATIAAASVDPGKGALEERLHQAADMLLLAKLIHTAFDLYDAPSVLGDGWAIQQEIDTTLREEVIRQAKKGFTVDTNKVRGVLKAYWDRFVRSHDGFFVTNANGSIDFGTIPAEQVSKRGLEGGEIRLPVRKFVHILTGHVNELKVDPLARIEEVAQHYDEILYSNHDLVLIYRGGGTPRALIVRLKADGHYYVVQTSFPMRASKIDKKIKTGQWQRL